MEGKRNLALETGILLFDWSSFNALLSLQTIIIFYLFFFFLLERFSIECRKTQNQGEHSSHSLKTDSNSVNQCHLEAKYKAESEFKLFYVVLRLLRTG